MRKHAFSFHLSAKWWAFPPAPFPGKGVTFVRRFATPDHAATVPPQPTFGSGA